MPRLIDLYDEYNELWSTMEIAPNMRTAVQMRASQVLMAPNRKRYQEVQNATGTPWMVIACIHSMESDLSFRGHLHNGDSLNNRTVRVPANRPRSGTPPFSWSDSAIDAIRMKDTDEISDWDIAECLFYFERYNGWGYRNGAGRRTTPPKRSPYLWSFSNHYEKGKYVADGQFSENAVSAQIGAATLLKVLVDQVGVEPGDFENIPNPISFDQPLLRRGARGEVVSQLQIFLRDAGYNPGDIDGVFGPRTEASVRRFQAAFFLTVDGVVGPETWRTLDPQGDDLIIVNEAPAGLRKDVLDFAIEEAEKERSHSPGSEIDKLVLDPLRPILVELGHLGSSQTDSFYNWCAAWTTYICRNAKTSVSIPDRYSDFWASVALVDAWRHMGIEVGAWFYVGSQVPKPGDIVVYNWDDDSDTDHIGILKEYNGMNRLIEVCEGNKGNSEGIFERSLSDVAGFIDLELLHDALKPTRSRRQRSSRPPHADPKKARR